MKQIVNTNNRVMKVNMNGIRSSKQYFTILIKNPIFSKIRTKNIIFAKAIRKMSNLSSGNIPVESSIPANFS
jgi:hypothetical protein